MPGITGGVHSAGAALGGAVAGVAGLAVGAGIASLIAVIMGKIKESRLKSEYRNLKVDKNGLEKWQVALEGRTKRMHLESDAETFIHAVGVQNLSSENPTVDPLCVELYNNWKTNAIQGDFIGLSGTIVDLYESIMHGVTDYLYQHNVLTWQGSNKGFSFKSREGGLEQGPVGMIMFGNELSMLLLYLSQVANQVTTDEKQRGAKIAQTKKIVEAIHLSVNEAFNNVGLLRRNRTRFGAAAKKVLRAVAGFENGREVSFKMLHDNIKAAESKSPTEKSMIEELRETMINEADKKADQAIASELMLSAHSASNESYQTAVAATQIADSKAIGPALPAHTYFKGFVSQPTVLHKANTQVQLTENRDMWDYMTKPFDSNHQDVVSLPHGAPQFKAVGDLSRESKLTPMDRSADFVAPANAKVAMLEWAHITYLRKVVEQITDAYSEEVRMGGGAKSPTALYFLTLIDQGLSQIKTLYHKLANSIFFTQMIKRSKTSYQKAGEELAVSNYDVVIGIPSDKTEVRKQSIADFLGADDPGNDNLKDITKIEGSTLCDGLRKDMAWHVHMQGHVTNLIKSHRIDKTRTSDMSSWEVAGARSKAWSLISSLMANLQVDGSSDEGFNQFKQDIVNWPVEHAKLLGNTTATAQVAQKHKEVTEAYAKAISAANKMLVAVNDFLRKLKIKDQNTYDQLKNEINKDVKPHNLLSFSEDNKGALSISLLQYNLTSALDYHNLSKNLSIIVDKVSLRLPVNVSQQVFDQMGQSSDNKTALEWISECNPYRELLGTNSVLLLTAQKKFPKLHQQEAFLLEAQSKEAITRAKDNEQHVIGLAATVDALTTEKAETEALIAQISSKMIRQAGAVASTAGDMSTQLGEQKEELDTLGEKLKNINKDLDQFIETQGKLTLEQTRLTQEVLDTLALAQNTFKAEAEQVEKLMTSQSDGFKEIFNTPNLSEDVKNLTQQQSKALIETLTATYQRLDETAKQIKQKIDAFSVKNITLTEESEKQLEQLRKVQTEIEGVVERIKALESRVSTLESTVIGIIGNAREMKEDLILLSQVVTGLVNIREQRPNVESESLEHIDTNKKDIKSSTFQAKEDAINELFKDFSDKLKQYHQANNGDQKVADKVRDQTKLFSSLCMLIGAASTHRSKVIPLLAGPTKSAVNVASALFPKKQGTNEERASSQEARGRLIELLKDYTSSLEEKWKVNKITEPYSIPHSFRILGEKTNDILASLSSKHCLTPRKLLKILEDITRIHYALTHKGEKPSFTGGFELTVKNAWLAKAKEYSLESGPTLAHAQRAAQSSVPTNEAVTVAMTPGNGQGDPQPHP